MQFYRDLKSAADKYLAGSEPLESLIKLIDYKKDVLNAELRKVYDLKPKNTKNS